MYASRHAISSLHCPCVRPFIPNVQPLSPVILVLFTCCSVPLKLSFIQPSSALSTCTAQSASFTLLRNNSTLLVFYVRPLTHTMHPSSLRLIPCFLVSCVLYLLCTLLPYILRVSISFTSFFHFIFPQCILTSSLSLPSYPPSCLSLHHPSHCFNFYILRCFLHAFLPIHSNILCKPFFLSPFLPTPI